MYPLMAFNFPFQSPYGEPVEPEKAPEAISKAVASLPPEQMFELMKQMKVVLFMCGWIWGEGSSLGLH